MTLALHFSPGLKPRRGCSRHNGPLRSVLLWRLKRQSPFPLHLLIPSSGVEALPRSARSFFFRASLLTLLFLRPLPSGSTSSQSVCSACLPPPPALPWVSGAFHIDPLLPNGWYMHLLAPIVLVSQHPSSHPRGAGALGPSPASPWQASWPCTPLPLSSAAATSPQQP